MMRYFMSVIVAAAVLVGCSEMKAIDSNIEDWEQEQSRDYYTTHYYHISKEMEELRESVETLVYMRGDIPSETSWRTLSTSVNSFNRKKLMAVLQKSRDSLVNIFTQTRAEFIGLLESLDMSPELRQKYFDFDTEFRLWEGAESITLMSISSDGVLRNQLYKLRQTSEELSAARENYVRSFAFTRIKSDGTYEYVFRIRNSNEDVPLFVKDPGLDHKRDGAVSSKPLSVNNDYSVDFEEFMLKPGEEGEFHFTVDRYYGEYGSLSCTYKVALGWHN